MNGLLGQQFGEYRLTRFLGNGTFADVYEAEHIQSKKQVAVKLLKDTFTEQDTFLKEVRLAASLDHAHIINVLTFGVERNISYLVMSYAPKGSLDKLYPIGKKLPLSTIVSYVNQVADALQYAHEHKVIHRDIKPANLLLGTEGQVLVADFGLAEPAHRTISWVEQDVAGTPLYMAPEQSQAHARPASDQYSLGVVVYQWLCGEPPFRGNIFSLLTQHKEAPPPPLREKIPISAAVEGVVLKALAKEPHNRFPSVQDFARALEQAYMEEIKTLFSTPERAVKVLMQEQEPAQQILLDLVVSDRNWWNTIGQAVINSSHVYAVRESRADLLGMLSALAQRATNRLEAAVKRGDKEGFASLLDLLSSLAPPSTNLHIWTFLLESLSANQQAVTLVTTTWEIHARLLKQWGNIASSVENSRIRLWFPKTWSTFWLFLMLALPEDWHDIALSDLLDTTMAAPLPAAVVRSIEQEHGPLIESYLYRPFRSYQQQVTARRLFSKLVESGYSRKMDLLHTLLTSDIGSKHTKDFVEQVLEAARLTEEESARFLERYGEKIRSYYQLPIMLDYVKQYLLTFSPNDLDRPSARGLIQLMSDSPLLPMPQKIRDLAKNWQTVSTFIERPVISKKDLLALTRTIYQLQPPTYSALADKLVVSFTSCVKSEIDLMCVIYAMSSILAEPDLLRLLQQMAERVGEEYKRQRWEAILVPYIRIALQVEVIVHDLSRAEQQDFVNHFLDTLLRHADRETYNSLSTSVQNWPAPMSERWHTYWSLTHNPLPAAERRRRWPWNVP